jgi:hypothetical protein
MSDDQNAAPERPQPTKASRTVSRAPAPPPRLEPSGWSLGHPKKDTTGELKLQKLKQALWRCEELIRSARTLRRFRGSLWDAEKKRWDIYRPQIDDGLKLCKEAGLSADREFIELLPPIEVLDAEWSVACELRRRGKAPFETDDNAATESTSLEVSKVEPSDPFASFVERTGQIRAEDEARQEQERCIDIGKSIAQSRRFESERVRAKPDWLRWSRLSEQILRVDKWSACRG